MSKNIKLHIEFELPAGYSDDEIRLMHNGCAIILSKYLERFGMEPLDVEITEKVIVFE